VKGDGWLCAKKYLPKVTLLAVLEWDQIVKEMDFGKREWTRI